MKHLYIAIRSNKTKKGTSRANLEVVFGNVIVEQWAVISVCSILKIQLYKKRDDIGN